MLLALEKKERHLSAGQGKEEKKRSAQKFFPFYVQKKGKEEDSVVDLPCGEKEKEEKKGFYPITGTKAKGKTFSNETVSRNGKKKG